MSPRLALAILLLALSACEQSSPPADTAAPGVSRDRAEALYLKHCAICHGERGDGRGPRRGSLFHKPPDFRQPAWRQGMSLADIRTVIRNGIPGSDMPAWASLDATEISGLARYVVAIAQAPGTDEPND